MSKEKREKTHEYICLFLLPVGINKVSPLQVIANMGRCPGTICGEAGCMIQETLPSSQGNLLNLLVERTTLSMAYPSIPLFLNLEPFMEVCRVVVLIKFSL